MRAEGLTKGIVRMKRMFGLPVLIVWGAAALFLGALVCLAQNDDQMERIRSIEAEMERSMRELEDGEKKLSSLKNQEKKGLAQLDIIEKNIVSTNQNLLTIRNEERTLEQRITAAQARYETAKNTLEDRSDLYSQRIRAMYERQHMSPLTMVAKAGSVGASLRGFAMFRAVTEADLMVLDDLEKQSRELRDSMTQLSQSLEAKRRLGDAKQREQVTLSSSRAKQQEILNSLLKDERQQEDLNRKYRDDIEEAQAEKNRFIREHEQSKTPAPVSLKGYDLSKLRGKLPWPVKGEVVSTFGRQVDARTKTVTENRGIEIETGIDEPVLAIGRGQVVITRYLRGYGNFVMLYHPPDYYSIYGHLADILVAPGQVVGEGDIVGIAGNTGLILDSAPRLVFEILIGEKPDNPLSWLAQNGQRVQR